MIGNNGIFRPWGEIQKILGSQTDEQWALIGCVSAESRCTAIFSSMIQLGITGSQLIFDIEDPLSISTQEVKEKTAENLSLISNMEFPQQSICEIELTDPFKFYEQALKEFFASLGQSNLIVDITSLPKKVYFFLTKMIYENQNGPQNVIFTYAEAQSYSKDQLAENPDPWEALPGFRISPNEEKGRTVVVGIGYEPLGLPDLVNSGKFDETNITFLFPFPAQADTIARNWRFLRGIFPNVDANRLSIKRVDGINVPEIFEMLSSLGEEGSNGLILGPFGPKPMSLAMALYASKYSNLNAQTGVYYTQPTYYNPSYSEGIRVINGAPVINSYCLKINGQLLY